MKRIDTPTAVGGRFVSGNPQTSQKATRIGAEWLNNIQEEIANAIELAGIVLNGASQRQLYDAMVLIAAGAAGAGGGSVPTTRQVLASGLATGGGNLVSDRTIDVPKASAAEVLAGLIDTKAVTPASLASAFARSLTANGYITVPLGGGMIIQWMSGTAGGNTTTNFTLPTTFPNACFAAFCNGGRTATDSSDNPPFVTGVGTTTISVFNDINTSTGVMILALGY